MGRTIMFSAFSGFVSNFHMKTDWNDGLVRRADKDGEIRSLVDLWHSRAQDKETHA